MEKIKFTNKFKNEYLEDKERAIKRIIRNINYGLNSIMENVEIPTEELEFIKNLQIQDMEILEKYTRDIIEILKWETAKKDSQE